MHLTQIAQHADDLDRAEAFYTELLGAPAAARFDPPGLLFFELDGTRLLLDRAAPSALIYLRVTGIHLRIEELQASGVAIENEPSVIFSHEDDRLGPANSDEWQAFIRDSEGNLVALVEQVPQSEP
ncbi:VOC family protein [Curtobacterium ammoniigenes]|uniref:VOC family protein n=1 Tax=Curtobacterium ammoniigenes TaxID=395387 RepID=UPI000833DE6B|nr:VOC family protein [Curtobacterium ammoniigenes]